MCRRISPVRADMGGEEILYFIAQFRLEHDIYVQCRYVVLMLVLILDSLYF